MNIFDTTNNFVCFSFEEANIFIENYKGCDLGGIIARLDNLLQHTSDLYLKREAKSLLEKLQNLTPEEYGILSKDAVRGTILFPPNYHLPYVEQRLDF